MPDYAVTIDIPGGASTLFETVVSGVETPQEAASIGVARWSLRDYERTPDAWLDVFQLPERDLVLRVPVSLIGRRKQPAQ